MDNHVSLTIEGRTAFYRRPFIKDGEELGGGVSANCHGDYCSFHVEFRKWSHNLVKWYKQEFEIIKKELGELGVKFIFAASPDVNDLKWDKMIKIFGFCPPVINKVSMLEVV